MSTSAITPGTCMHCGMIHTGVGQCPRVKAVEYYENGMVKRVEYNEWPMVTRDPVGPTTWPFVPTWERQDR